MTTVNKVNKIALYIQTEIAEYTEYGIRDHVFNDYVIIEYEA